MEREIEQLKRRIRELEAGQERLTQSAERHRALLSALPDLIFLLDRGGVFLDYSVPPDAELFLPPEDFLGRNVRDIMPAAVADRGRTMARRALERGEVEAFEYRLTINEVPGDFEARIVPCGEDQVLVVVRDITARRRSEKALRDSEALRRSITDSSPDYILMIDPEGRILFINHTLPEYTVAGVIGRTVYELLPEHSAKEMKQTVETVLRTGETSRFEIEHQGENDIRYFDARVGAVRRDGEIVSLIVNASDVTERRLLETRLQHAQKMQAIGRLAGGIAHDFNNLLTVITGYTQILLDSDDVGESSRSAAEQIRHASDRAATLTRQLLAFSRRQFLRLKVLSLNRVVADMKAMLSRLIGEDITLVMELAPDAGNIQADPAQMEQILMNLVLNARDAMPHGGTLTIATSKAPDGDRVRLRVKDTGTGMDRETRERIFEPFFTTKEESKGTGLGLATVYGIVQQSGGHIEVESTPGEGSLFTLVFPAVNEDLDPKTPREGIDLSGEPIQGTILVVEDEGLVRKLVCKSLEGAGFSVLEAANGDQALEVAAAAREPLRAVVTDIVMPGMSGMELARRLEATQPGIRALFMSGYLERTGSAHDLPPDEAFIEKPFRPDELIGRLVELLETP